MRLFQEFQIYMNLEDKVLPRAMECNETEKWAVLDVC